jgi:hypothetical protein
MLPHDRLQDDEIFLEVSHEVSNPTTSLRQPLLAHTVRDDLSIMCCQGAKGSPTSQVSVPHASHCFIFQDQRTMIKAHQRAVRRFDHRETSTKSRLLPRLSTSMESARLVTILVRRVPSTISSSPHANTLSASLTGRCYPRSTLAWA